MFHCYSTVQVSQVCKFSLSEATLQQIADILRGICPTTSTVHVIPLHVASKRIVVHVVASIIMAAVRASPIEFQQL